jgi:hypothetical protein
MSMWYIGDTSKKMTYQFPAKSLKVMVPVTRLELVTY